MPNVGLVLLGGLHAGAYADFITYEVDPATRRKIVLVKTSPAIAPQYAELELPCTSAFKDLFGELHCAHIDGPQRKDHQAAKKAANRPSEDMFFARIRGKTVPIGITESAFVREPSTIDDGDDSLVEVSGACYHDVRLAGMTLTHRDSLPGFKHEEEAPASVQAPVDAASALEQEESETPSARKSTNPTMNASAAEIRAALRRFTMGSSTLPPAPRRAVTGRDKNKGPIFTDLPASSNLKLRNTKIKLFPIHSRPCIDFYLAPDGCPRGSKCTFDHAYEFSEEEWNVFPAFVKQLVCKRKATGGKCSHGKDCPYGHSCAHTASSCPFREACWFLQAGLPHANEV